jgi:hypothetical protein
MQLDASGDRREPHAHTPTAIDASPEGAS